MGFVLEIYCRADAVSAPEADFHFRRRWGLAQGEKTVRRFADFGALCHFVRKRGDEYAESIVRATMCTPKESLRHRVVYELNSWRKAGPIGVYWLGYLLKDETGRIWDLRHYREELFGFDYDAYAEQLERRRRERLSRAQDIRESAWEKSRSLNERKPYWSYYRAVRTARERRYAASDEHRPYIRGKRSMANLPSVYDDLYFRGEKSWKARAKARRQWGAKMKSHADCMAKPGRWAEILACEDGGI